MTQGRFGHIDLLKNQHPDVMQEKIPTIAIYKDGVELHSFERFFVGDL